MRGSGDMTEVLLEFVSAAVRQPVAADDDYFDLGLADSLFALELVTFVEHRFGITVEVEDLDLDNFRTARRLSGFIAAKLAVRPL